MLYQLFLKKSLKLYEIPFYPHSLIAIAFDHSFTPKSIDSGQQSIHAKFKATRGLSFAFDSLFDQSK